VYNLARHLTRNDHDAEDIAQHVYLRAFRFYDGFSSRRGRAPFGVPITRSVRLRKARISCLWVKTNRGFLALGYSILYKML
jgi:DNA-directed RNA polymerase specialized sigma24 family protein